MDATGKTFYSQLLLLVLNEHLNLEHGVPEGKTVGLNTSREYGKTLHRVCFGRSATDKT